MQPLFAVEAGVSSQASPYRICGAQSKTGTGSSLSTSVLPYCMNTPYLHFIHLPSTTCSLSNWRRQIKQ